MHGFEELHAFRSLWFVGFMEHVADVDQVRRGRQEIQTRCPWKDRVK